MFTKYMKNQLILTPLQNLCSCLGLVHICNHGLHGFLLLNVFVKKNMKTQLILTILNFHCFSYLWFPKIFKMKMSHVCSGNAAERLFCFTSAAKMLTFLLVRWFPYSEAVVFVTSCKTPAAFTVLPRCALNQWKTNGFACFSCAGRSCWRLRFADDASFDRCPSRYVLGVQRLV